MIKNFKYSKMLCLLLTASCFLGCSNQKTNQEYEQTALPTETSFLHEPTPTQNLDQMLPEETPDDNLVINPNINATEMFEDSNYIYYQHWDVETKGLYKQEKSTGDETLIVKLDYDKEVWGQCLDGNLIYYSETDRYYSETGDNEYFNFTIYRIDTDGENRIPILDSSFTAEYNNGYDIGRLIRKLKVSGDFIVFEFAPAYSVYYYDMKNDEITYVGTTKSNFHIYNDKLYLIRQREWSISEIDLITKEEVVLLASENPHEKELQNYIHKEFIIIDGEIYYFMSEPHGVYRYNNNDIKLISDYPHIDQQGLYNYEDKLCFFHFVYGEVSGAFMMLYDPELDSLQEVMFCKDYQHISKISDGYLYYSDSGYKNTYKLKIEI